MVNSVVIIRVSKTILLNYRVHVIFLISNFEVFERFK